MRRFLVATICSVSTLWSAAVQSEPLRPLDFALYIGQTKTRLAYADADVDTTVQRIGVNWQEHYGEGLRLGLLGGYSFVTQTGNAPTAGLDLDGYHVGVSFNVDLIQHRPFAVFLAGAYVYEHTKHEGSTQSVDLSWIEPNIRLGMVFNLTDRLRLAGGVQYGYIDGQERIRGAVNQTSDIERRHDTGGFAGLELTVDANAGYVGIAGQSGTERGGAIYFGRQF